MASLASAAAIHLAEMIAREERQALVPLEAVDEALYAGRRPLVVVVGFPHAVGTPMCEGIFFAFEVAELDVSRRRHF